MIVKELEANASKYNFWQKTIHMEVTRFEDLENLRQDLNLRLSLWSSLDEWEYLASQWIDTPFSKIEAEHIRLKCENYSKIVNRCNKYMPPNPVLDKLKHKVFEFRDTIPVVTALRNPCLTENHWKQLKSEIIGRTFDIEDPTFTLKSLLDLNVQAHQKQILDVSTQAT